MLAAKRVRQGEEDEEEAQQERSVRSKVETETGEVQQRSGKAEGGKGTRKQRSGESQVLHLWRRRPHQGAMSVSLVRAQDGLRKLVEFFTVCVVQRQRQRQMRRKR